MIYWDKLTRDEVREAFNRELTYTDVQTNDIRALQGFLCIEYAQHERNGEHMEMQPTYRKASQPEINVAENGGIESAFSGKRQRTQRSTSPRWRVRRCMMGFFNRKEKGESLNVVFQPQMIEPALISTGELEQMVYTTYQEKLELEKRLDAANERIKVLEDQATKIRAAETFSRQSEEERKRAEAKNDRLQRHIDSLEQQLKQERAKAQTLGIKVGELKNASSGQLASFRRELVEEMQRQAVSTSGGWSKNRVLDFLAGFLPEVEVVSDYDGTVMKSRDCGEDQ